MSLLAPPPEDRTLTLVAYLSWLAVFVERLFARGLTPRFALFAGLMLAMLAVMWWFMRSDGRPVLSTWLLALLAPAIMLAGTGGGSTAMVVIAAAQIGFTGEGRLQWAQLSLMNLVLLAGMVWLWPTRDALLNFPVFLGFQCFAVLCMRFAQRAQHAAEALRVVNASLLATRSLLEESARDQERLRLSRELHDIAGHKLTALKINLEVWRRAQVQSAPEIDTAIVVSDELLRDIRGVVAQLRAHDGIDLARALRALAAQWPRPKVELDLDAELRVPSLEQAEALLRIAQEGITNAARHGQASLVRLVLRGDGEGLQLVVEDNGRGLPAQWQAGNGLRGMQERVAALGGTLQVLPATPQGLRLQAALPSAAAGALA